MNLIATAFAALLLASPAFCAPTPPFKVAAVLNAPVKKIDGIADLKGKVVVLEFWATWCHPCVAGIPRMNRLIDSMKGEPVVFLSVTDEAPETIAAFLKTHEMKAWVGLDAEGSAFKAFDVTGRPTAFLIGKDGGLLAKVWPDMLREKDLREAVAGTFKEQPIVKDEEPPAAAPMKDDFPGKPVTELRITLGGEAKKKMEGDKNRVEVTGLPFRPTLAYGLGIQYDQLIVDAKDLPQFNFRLSVPDDQVESGREMLRKAVEDDFKVKIVRETRKTDVLTMIRLPGAPAPKTVAPGTATGMISMGSGEVLGSMSMAETAQCLWMSLGKPVLDETGLAGAYDVDLQWKDGDGADRARALAALGLELVPARRPVLFYRVVKAP